MYAEICNGNESLNKSEAGKAACAEYVGAILAGTNLADAEIRGSNVLQRAGYNVNATGGVSFRLATIDHNDEPGARVSLLLARDAAGFYVETGDGEDTEARFASADAAYNSISQRWGNGWGLTLAEGE